MYVRSLTHHYQPHFFFEAFISRIDLPDQYSLRMD